jgi:hypothetical protein
MVRLEEEQVIEEVKTIITDEEENVKSKAIHLRNRARAD